ncbi:hypothetical protein EDC15_1381, partial [Acetobacter aceti NBRC 14818]
IISASVGTLKYDDIIKSGITGQHDALQYAVTPEP